eukprot:TRINITY_DN9679_c0_g1_i1.p2 TRINITY_DN9679_c0_g1~~TRINITY_DN9679_c0_g1_i1.p2  ORF type:complete len:214 (-),score=-32.99 TRINITY_DN9679_c0_g1_i1:309-950(-)
MNLADQVALGRIAFIKCEGPGHRFAICHPAKVYASVRSLIDLRAELPLIQSVILKLRSFRLELTFGLGRRRVRVPLQRRLRIVAGMRRGDRVLRFLIDLVLMDAAVLARAVAPRAAGPTAASRHPAARGATARARTAASIRTRSIRNRRTRSPRRIPATIRRRRWSGTRTRRRPRPNVNSRRKLRSLRMTDCMRGSSARKSISDLTEAYTLAG